MSTDQTITAPDTFSSYVRAWLEKVRQGDLGSLPIVVGLIVIVIIFGTLKPVFLSSANFVNLLLQMSVFAIIGMGVVFVLLIAEIDLSVAYVSAIGGVVMTLLLRPDDPGWPWPVAILVALAITTSIGLLHALIVTRFGVPSFVVTLAGLLAWNGVVLILTTEASTSGTTIIQDDAVIGIANSFLPPAWSWLMGVGILVAFVGLELRTAILRRRRELPAKPLTVIAFQAVAIAAGLLAAIGFANADRGVPFVIVIVIVFLALLTFLATKTRFGRHVYAVGGNPEATRRAGINVDRIRVQAFMIGSFMAGVGGIVAASRLRSVATSQGGGDLLLAVIAAAVIGGTSLFGGSGRVVSAVFGALVIASVNNGMGLLGLPSGVKFVVTGLVLLAAVLVDAISKRRRVTSGVR